MSTPARSTEPLGRQVRRYWEQHIHDLEISRHAPGSSGFFADLEQYHFEKLHHLPRLIPFETSRDRRILDVGCGAGVDLARFARSGARVTGIDVAESAIALARENLRQQGLHARLLVADGELMPFSDASFDLVYAHGIVQYAAGDRAVVEECRRVARPGGQVIVQVYNRISWLNALSKVMRVDLEHEDAPVLRKYTAAELRRLLGGFRKVRIVAERFPVRSRLHGGWKGALYNTLFVGPFNLLPRPLVARFGWHLLAFCTR